MENVKRRNFISEMDEKLLLLFLMVTSKFHASTILSKPKGLSLCYTLTRRWVIQLGFGNYWNCLHERVLFLNKNHWDFSTCKFGGKALSDWICSHIVDPSFASRNHKTLFIIYVISWKIFTKKGSRENAVRIFIIQQDCMHAGSVLSWVQFSFPKILDVKSNSSFKPQVAEPEGKQQMINCGSRRITN